MLDTQRIDELRRRVQKDPTSIAFAQLAEECRRAGEYQEAIAVCHAGLSVHPGYTSARVTLGRALIQVDRLDEAKAELDRVLAAAPDNLAAIRGVAQVHERQGQLAEALVHYRTALSQAPNDPDLEQTVARLARNMAAGQRDSPPAAIHATTDDGEPGQAARTLVALEQWLDAIYVARADRRA